MIKPKALKKGDAVGLIAPASPVRIPDGVERAKARIEQMGFRVILGESPGKVYGHLSGSDETRARDVNAMFLDPRVDAIFCLRGGYGTPRILDRLDYAAIRRRPKLFVGYSDITALHSAFHMLCSMVTFHGPMPASDMISDDYPAFTQQCFVRAVTSTEPLGLLKNPPGEPMETIIGGRARGLLCGGNLTLVTATLGTRYELDTRGKILLLEDIGEKTYRIDCMLTQLRLAGKFDDCAGIVLGDFTDCTVEFEDYGLSLEKVFADVVAPAKKPTVCRFRAGHCANKITVPLGTMCELDADAGEVRILESALLDY